MGQPGKIHYMRPRFKNELGYHTACGRFIIDHEVTRSLDNVTCGLCKNSAIYKTIKRVRMSFR